MTFDCTRSVSLADVVNGDADAYDLRDARQACGCLCCAYGGVTPTGRETIDDLQG